MSWPEFIKEINMLGNNVTNKPDIIVGIVRGGLVPARILASNLGVKEVYCLTVQKTDKSRNLTTQITADIRGKKVLIVEDALETGKSLEVVKKYVESLGAEVQTLAMYVWPKSVIVPDYYLKITDNIPIFPWE